MYFIYNITIYYFFNNNSFSSRVILNIDCVIKENGDNMEKYVNIKTAI